MNHGVLQQIDTPQNLYDHPANIFVAGFIGSPSMNFLDATLVKQTACLRPLTPDGLPVIGSVPGTDGVYVATGGGTKGILLAPAMGQAIADISAPGGAINCTRPRPAKTAGLSGPVITADR